MQVLGSLLATARKRAKLSLRDVEKKVGISNAYLSQLEGGTAQNPSPGLLHKLSELYNLSYSTLLQLAGHPVPGRDKVDTKNAGFAARLGPTTSEEQDALVDYLEFLRSKSRNGGRP